jgi:hypothetical protein
MRYGSSVNRRQTGHVTCHVASSRASTIATFEHRGQVYWSAIGVVNPSVIAARRVCHLRARAADRPTAWCTRSAGPRSVCDQRACLRWPRSDGGPWALEPAPAANTCSSTVGCSRRLPARAIRLSSVPVVVRILARPHLETGNLQERPVIPRASRIVHRSMLDVDERGLA